MSVYQEDGRNLEFGVSSNYQSVLDAQSISPDLRGKFEDNGITLSRNVTVSIQKEGRKWLITDQDNQKKYVVKKGVGELKVSEGKSQRQKVKYALRLVLDFGIVGMLVILFILSTFGLTPHDPEAPDDILNLSMVKEYRPPFQSTQYPLGTDEHDRDILSRLIAGSSPYFLPGLTAVVISLGLGLLLGTGAGFYGGRLKGRINIFVSIINSFPRLVLFLLFMAILKINIWVIMVLLGLFNAPKVATLVEGKVHALKSTDFIEAARALGLKDGKIIWYHIILKNCLALLLVQATYGLTDAILVETTLSYLGFGPPGVSWGKMVFDGKKVFFPAQGQPFYKGKFWVSSIPAIMIMIAILGLHKAGDSLNRILEEK